MSELNLNQGGLRSCRRLVEQAALHRARIVPGDHGARIIDCGIESVGGLEAGRALAEVCLADLGRVDLAGGSDASIGPAVIVSTDHPVAACMASQYAGWRIDGERFFAMGSGPMRAARGREPLFDRIGYREDAPDVVGVLETRRIPGGEVVEKIASECGIQPENLTLLVAPTASLAGTVQIVARTIETALHKMHELGFEISRVTSGFGRAPLPPVAADDISAIGRTNDAVLYGGEVTLWVRGDDDSMAEVGPRVPSSDSADHGQPFAEIFERYERDFYKIDPLLFSPAVVTLVNIDTGRTFRHGEIERDVLRQSFA